MWLLDKTIVALFLISVFCWLVTLTIYMSSLEKYPSKSLFHFLNWVIRVFSFLLLSCRSYLCVLEINSLSDIRFHKYFLSFHGLPFILLFPLLCRSFLVWSPTYLFFILLSVLLMSFPKLISWGFPLILEVIYIFLILCWSFYLAWKIPWMEEPGGLPSMGSLSQRRLSDSRSLFTFMHWRRKWQPTQCSCLENPREGAHQGSLVGCHKWGHTELDTTEVT